MNIRLLITKSSLTQQPTAQLLRIQQRSRFGTLAWNNNNNNSYGLQAIAAAESFIHRTFQVPAWLEPFLWAAPKKKTSHSKKRMRASNKGLQNKENIGTCPACGHPKLLHHLCGNCYKNIKEKAKSLLFS
ncbi:hypothetical protein BDF20DRAFT_883927 [Mycotypha africana]|uniref:uncharacterized protein n=1 Tax=Mycotypha africana TaxID=64632 RepID=UPI002300BBD0|nr:uncharacterized protein BDF20DRAFT_883927 [Mycotypha africana]KAI8973759.1 hypothetical protein BDF20DRAFT_883927 [Mycotypha africana]